MLKEDLKSSKDDEDKQIAIKRIMSEFIKLGKKSGTPVDDCEVADILRSLIDDERKVLLLLMKSNSELNPRQFDFLMYYLILSRELCNNG